ncbi:hypothetical protein ACSBR2_034240 [Camellia fascicularis]
MYGPYFNQPVASDDEHIVIPMASNLDDAWLESIMNKEGESSSSSLNNTPMPKHKKIRKVLKMLLQIKSKKKCYEPKVVSISPYHHDQAKLQSFEKLKIRFTKEAFTRMLFLDGCFIIHYINICTKDKEEQDKMKMKSHDKACVQRDLFLLENQLPFIVLYALMSMNSDFEGDKVLKLIKNFMQNMRASPSPSRHLFWEMVEILITNITRRNSKESNKSNSQLVELAHLVELMCRQLIELEAFHTKQKRNNWHIYAQYPHHSAMDLKMVGDLIQALLS